MHFDKYVEKRGSKNSNDFLNKIPVKLKEIFKHLRNNKFLIMGNDSKNDYYNFWYLINPPAAFTGAIYPPPSPPEKTAFMFNLINEFFTKFDKLITNSEICKKKKNVQVGN